MSATSPEAGQTPEPALDGDSEILAAVGFAAEFSMREGSEESVIPEILEKLGSSVNASRAYLFQNTTSDQGELLMDEIYEWCSPGVGPTITDPSNHASPYLPEHSSYVDLLGSGKELILTRSTASGSDLDDLIDEGILSSLSVPVFLRDRWWGFLGFDDCVSEREWGRSEIDALNAAAAFIGITMARIEERSLAEVTAPSFRTLVDRIPAITYVDIVKDPDSYPYPTLYMSPHVEEVLGYPAERFVDDDDFWDSIIHPDDLETIKHADLDTIAEERFEGEYRMIAADGSVVWVHDEAERVSFTPDLREVWHGVIYDITALKEEAEREREAADKLRSLDALKDTFLDAVSHELRTPVAAIMGLSLTLERDEGGLTESERRDFAGRIARNARKLQRLIEDLLDTGRLNRDVLELQRSVTRIDRIAMRALEEADMPDTHPVSLEVEPVEAPVDASKVERIIENLLFNAARHTPTGTRVTLSVHAREGGALIRVDDDGPGVPPALREAIFHPFRQGERHPTQGTGLGLSLVTRFAELHGGRAWVEDGPSGGASFRVFLPGS